MEQMPGNIGGLSHTEYLVVFNTIIFGVVASEFFAGWGTMLRHRSQIKLSLIHLAWTIFAFLTLIQNWYGIWPRTAFINQGFFYFLYALIPMLMFHLITVVLFPSPKLLSSSINLEKHYFDNSRVLYILFAVYLCFSISSSFVYVDRGDVLAQNIMRLGGIVLCLSAAYFDKVKWLHIIFLSIGFGTLIEFIFKIPK